MLDRNGAVYGTAVGGGSDGGGTVYKLTPPAQRNGGWTETTLWSFSAFSSGGSFPQGLIADKSGTLYGVTLFGTSEVNGGCGYDYNCGVVYSLTGTGGLCRNNPIGGALDFAAAASISRREIHFSLYVLVALSVANGLQPLIILQR